MSTTFTEINRHDYGADLWHSKKKSTTQLKWNGLAQKHFRET